MVYLIWIQYERTTKMEGFKEVGYLTTWRQFFLKNEENLQIQGLLSKYERKDTGRVPLKDSGISDEPNIKPSREPKGTPPMPPPPKK